MAIDKSRLVARLLWVFPALLLALTLSLVNAAFDLHETLTEGQPAIAEVTDFMKSDRVDVTYDYVSLRVTLPDGREVTGEKLSIPHSFAPLLVGRTELSVRVLPGADQEIILGEVDGNFLGRAQWRMAAINAAMALMGFVMLSIAVFAWNWYLKRQGDPANV